MKSLLQYGILIAVIIGAVFGLTFLMQNTSAPVEKNPASAGDATEEVSGSPLTVVEKVAVWDPEDPIYSAEFEKGSQGHYDFWVSNTHKTQVNVALLTASCVCTEVQLGIVPPAELAAWSQRTRDLVPANLAMGLLGVPNLAGVLANNGLENKVQWTVLNRRDRDSAAHGIEVPPADPKTGPQWAILRLSWDGKTPQSMRLSADLQHRIGTASEMTRFEVPVMIVSPVMLSNPALTIGDLNFNEQREVVVYVWSATREQFSVTIEDMSHDPCIVAGPARPLSSAELVAVPKELRSNAQIPPTKMVSGYAVPIVVYERREGHQLDLGPLSRRFLLRTDAVPDPSIVLVQGTVRGVVDVGEGKEKDRISLGTFRADRGKDSTVMVSAREPNVQLRVKSVTPDYLSVTLTELPGSVVLRQWKLTVGIDANKVSGLLPMDSAVYLETVGPSPRAIRVPVLGNATVR